MVGRAVVVTAVVRVAMVVGTGGATVDVVVDLVVLVGPAVDVAGVLRLA